MCFSVFLATVLSTSGHCKNNWFRRSIDVCRSCCISETHLISNLYIAIIGYYCDFDAPLFVILKIWVSLIRLWFVWLDATFRHPHPKFRAVCVVLTQFIDLCLIHSSTCFCFSINLASVCGLMPLGIVFTNHSISYVCHNRSTSTLNQVRFLQRSLCWFSVLYLVWCRKVAVECFRELTTYFK